MSSLVQSSDNNVRLSKGIVLGFFATFLIFYGIFISYFIEIYPTYQGEALPIFMTYIPLLCYIGAIFLGFGLLIFIRNVTKQKSRVIQSRKKVKTGSIYKEALLLVIFILVFIPLIGPIFDQGQNDQNFSVYNTSWNGASDFKATLEQDGYEVMTVQSSLSATERLNKSILLILLGPNQYYNPVFEIPYFIDFFENSTRNSLLICHDHGSTSTLLWEIFIASALDPDLQGLIPVTLFANGILYDNDSFDRRPEFPVIKNFSPHPTTNGINNVILSQASTVVGGPFISYFGWDLVGSSTDYGYVDKNGDGIYNFDDDYVDLSILGGAFGVPPKWPLGGYSQGIFMAKDSVSSRVFLSSDASLFDNELLSLPGYDNRDFGINIINWLTFNDLYDPKENWVIVFDEAHIRPEYSRDFTSAGIYGFITQYIIHLSTNPITAWIYPLLAVYTLKKYLPKKGEKEEKKKAELLEKKEERERFRTSSFFAEKIEWYRDKGRYDKALTLLNRRLDRKLNALLRGKKINTSNVIEMIISKDPKITKLKIKRITRFMERILLIKEGKSKIKNEQDFETLFFDMEWVFNNI
ncbi:MAG: hypothetical protein ACFFKA_14075 [Candidatus Thorarchaeota archaeon]